MESGRLQKEEALKVRVTKAGEASEKEKVKCGALSSFAFITARNGRQDEDFFFPSFKHSFAVVSE